MPLISRGRLFATLAVLAGVTVAGLGCRHAPLACGSGNLAGPAFPGGAPLDYPKRPAQDAEGPARRTVASEAPVHQVVWRASSQGLTDAPPIGRPVEEVAWRKVEIRVPAPVTSDLPRELDKVTMPPYVIEPPDVLLINVFRVIPRPPYQIRPLDELLIQGAMRDLLPNEPITGIYVVSPEGRVDLGYSYGTVPVVGLTPEEAAEAIRKHIAATLPIKKPALTVALARPRGLQPITGEHLVRMDGTVSLGVYGDVYVAGLTLPQARKVIEAHLSRTLLDPEVTVDVRAYNSKVYYVIFDGGGAGQRIVRLPVVGGETVLDALSRVNGLPPLSSDKKIWIARPVPGEVATRQILPVDWAAITQGGATNTNYQLFPGDRIYIKADPMMAFNIRMAKLLAPLGITLLGNSPVRGSGGPHNGF